MSKGSQPRQQRDDAAYRSNWEAIFGKDSQWTGKITFPAQTCGNCKHWMTEPIGDRNECHQQQVMEMCEGQYAEMGSFVTPANFGCNKWETKK